jgi:hypothetical protein
MWLERMKKGGGKLTHKSDLDNHSRQLDPECDEYWQSRGYDERPEDWEDRLDEDR